MSTEQPDKELFDALGGTEFACSLAFGTIIDILTEHGEHHAVEMMRSLQEAFDARTAALLKISGLDQGVPQ